MNRKDLVIYCGPAIWPGNDTGLSNKVFRKSWARLIQKIYEVDPLLCPKCQGPMKIISFIEEQAIIKQILQHLGLWEIRNNGPPPVPMNI
ncbi:MAG: hypothetical protein ACOCPQ_02325, partial [Desulfosudaceae bacterium]